MEWSFFAFLDFTDHLEAIKLKNYLYICIFIADLIIELLPSNGGGNQPPLRSCPDRGPGAGAAAPGGGGGRQPAGPARGDASHHRRLSGLHQGQIKTAKSEL